jgi:hypothetical protein
MSPFFSGDTKMHDFLDNLPNQQYQKMLREIANDNIVPKKTDKKVTNDLYENKEDDDFFELNEFGI